MTSEFLLRQNFDENKRKVLKHFEKSESLLRQDVEILKEWLRNQKHLPEVMNDRLIECFLYLNKFSIERVKEKLDMYYSIRTIFPEVFSHCNPKSPVAKKAQENIYWIPLPKTTEEASRVCIGKVLEPDVVDLTDFAIVALIRAEVRLNEDAIINDHYIFDLARITKVHPNWLDPTKLRRNVIIFESLYSLRIKAVHFVNCPPFIDLVFKLARGILKKKIVDRFHVHQDYESLHKMVPKNILPVEYGGDELSMKELDELWHKKQEEYQDRYDELDKLKVREELRLTKPINDESLGYYGNFKKIDID